jgi:hypothetical protein
MLTQQATLQCAGCVVFTLQSDWKNGKVTGAKQWVIALHERQRQQESRRQ